MVLFGILPKAARSHPNGHGALNRVDIRDELSIHHLSSIFFINLTVIIYI